MRTRGPPELVAVSAWSVVHGLSALWISGRLAERTDASETAAELNSGFYTLAADVFTASLRLHL